jgi:hypothetical protein
MTPEQLEQERAKFEKNIPESGITNYKQRLKSGEYAYDHIKFAWEMWQARAQQSAWISVDDRLPEPSNRPLLTLWEDGEITVGKYPRFGNGIVEWNESRFDRSRELAITHWQPLPEPPKAA